MKKLKQILSFAALAAMITTTQAQFTYTTFSNPAGGDTYGDAISGDNIVGSSVNGSYGFLYNGSSYSTFPFFPSGISGNNIVGQNTLYNFVTKTSTTIRIPIARTIWVNGIDGTNIVGYLRQDGVLYYLGYLYNGSTYRTFYVGKVDTFARAISGNIIVGEYFDGWYYHGFRYDGSTSTTLDVPGAVDTFPGGISGNNIVGYYWDRITYHGFLYNGSTFTTFDVPGASQTMAHGISGNKIVGTCTISGVAYGFVATSSYGRISGQLVNGSMQLSYFGVAGQKYALERCSSLSPASWIAQVTNAANSGGAVVFTNAPVLATNNFWRIRSVP